MENKTKRKKTRWYFLIDLSDENTGKYLQVACRPLSQIRLTALYGGATMVEKLKCLVGLEEKPRRD